MDVEKKPQKKQFFFKNWSFWGGIFQKLHSKLIRVRPACRSVSHDFARQAQVLAFFALLRFLRFVAFIESVAGLQ